MGAGAAPLQGRQFRSQMYFYYTNRVAHIYLAPGSNSPCSATVIKNFIGVNKSVVVVAIVCILFVF